MTEGGQESPLTFAFYGDHEEGFAARFATHLHDVFAGNGHRYLDTPTPQTRTVFNFVDLQRARPFRRKGVGTFVAAVALTDIEPDNPLASGYPLLVRALANMALLVSVREDGFTTHFITPERGCYSLACQNGGEDEHFASLYHRVAPLASAQLVIDNKFEPDLPAALWDGDEYTAQLSQAGRRLDALDLLPAPFPLNELLSDRDLRHLKRLYGIGGLSYGNLSVRRSASDFWMSASGVDKGNLQDVGRDMLLVTGFDPEQNAMLLSVPPDVEPRRVSVDAIEHWMVYSEHPQVGAIVHVHAWMEGIPSTEINYPCGSYELADAVAHHVRHAPDPAQAVVGLKNHGLTITGPTLENIFARLEERIVRQVPMA